MVAVRGTVIRASNLRPLCTQMAFRCLTCNAQQILLFSEGRYSQPTCCSGGGCRSRSFEVLRDSLDTVTVDSQVVRLQEILEGENREVGRVPRTLDCSLTHDLVDTCVPGDVVTVVGVVCVRDDEAVGPGAGRQKKDRCLFSIYIQANSLWNAIRNEDNSNQIGTEVVDLTSSRDMYAVQAIHQQPNLFRLLVHSLCPSIYGHETVKAGLLLGLFGGCQRDASSSQRIPIRGDPHVLVVGDPGLGKSQMLQAAANVAPRSVYVCGNTTTASGLTVTVSRESGSSDFSLDAGALVLADRGCCCIDEFDKMSSQHQALLEAMEQQCISIAKAGIMCSLPARASILAAANPVGGHYNRSRTVSENLKLSGPLLSRFDLVFIMLDKPDQELDSMLSDHVMKMHSGRRGNPGYSQSQSSITSSTVHQSSNERKDILNRLRLKRGEPVEPIPHEILRKYVEYARNFVHPMLSEESCAVLRNFYLDLRRRYHRSDSVPITTRQLESLVRLTEARARCELRVSTSAQDARDVVELMRDSMLDVYTDETGLVDFTRSQHGSGMSGRGAGKRLVAALQQEAERTYNALFNRDRIRQVATQAQLPLQNLHDLVASLNNQGYLLQKGGGVFQLQTAGF